MKSYKGISMALCYCMVTARNISRYTLNVVVNQPTVWFLYDMPLLQTEFHLSKV